jgi:hypothetical protein
MSQSYFPSGMESVATDRSAGYPPMPPRGYDPGFGHDAPQGHDPGYPVEPQGYGQGYPGQAGPPPAPRRKQPVPRWVIVAMSGLSALSLGLGALTFASNAKVGDAESKAADVTESLDKATASLTATEKKLDEATKQAEAGSQAAADSQAALDVAVACATGLNEAWQDLLADDVDAAVTALDDATKVCEPLFGATSQ